MTTFVTADWVSERILRQAQDERGSEFLIIDPRSAMRYLMGHLRGAVSVPFKKLQGPDGKLAEPELLGAAFGNVGLGDDVTPILYDHQDGRNAAMAAWVLEYLGRDDVHIMNLRYESWKDQGHEVLYRPVPAEAKSFTVRVNPSLRATLGDVADSGEAILLDTRTEEEFDGQVEMDHRPGHIPGAVNLPHTETTGTDGDLLIDEFVLRERLGIVGIANNDSVIAYCRSGVRASVTWLAMRQVGYDVRLYDGSYAEWMDSDQPVTV